ncbi:MAG: peptide chain release factor N(5)-glutamine methyltransferase [Actinomycetota bacterium]
MRTGRRLLTPTELREVVIGLLRSGGIETAEREGDWILEAATGLDRTRYAAESRPLDAATAERALALAARRAAGEPLQYVTGVAGFRRLELAVGPGVFIPRPETEGVAGRVIDSARRNGTVVEVGTGSGAIALAVADERPDLHVYATERSRDALEWARRNRDALDLDVELIEGDLFEGLPERLRSAVDVVVSNPPYVPEGFTLPAVIHEHEPHVALFAKDGGLSIIRSLARDGLSWLRPGGHIVLEIGEAQRDAVARLLHDEGYGSVLVSLDPAGRERVAEGRAP